MVENQPNTQALASIIVVLNRPQEAVNIGAVVRAMKNMGLRSLRLVQPETFQHDELLRVAHRCDDIIAQMAVHSTLDEALADTIYVVGTAAIAHPQRPLTRDVRGLADELLQRGQQGKVALLFGQEDDGLDNYALDRCHLIAMVPTDPAYPALNLAQSVLLLLYELRMAALDAPAPTPIIAEVPAPQAELEELFQLSKATLTAINFFRYNPDTVMRTLRQFVYRAAPSSAELKLLSAVLRKLAKAQEG